MSAAGVRPGERLCDRFVVGEEIGRGGIARVFAATDEALGQEVALKVLLPQHAEARLVRLRFRREAEVCRRLAHPNIVRVFDLHDDGDRSFISMERVAGTTLAERLHEAGPPGREERLGIVRALGAALAYAHRQGVVHRDLKPQNVMIEPGGTVRLLDFGLARVESVAGLTSHSVLLGTPDYMAPEAAAGLPVDSRADIYSLGVLWFELCTGRRPFSGAGALDLLRQMSETDGPLPAGADTDAAESAAVEACLRHLPHQRPATVAALFQRLDHARPPSPVARDPRRICGACGTDSPAAFPLCLGCGAERGQGASGSAMLVLTRVDGDRDAVVSTLAALGKTPDPTRDTDVALGRTPVVLLAGISATYARAVQGRLLSLGATTEVRDAAEDNFDLLHRSGTPGLFLVGGLLVSWAALVWLGWTTAEALGASVCLLAGPPVGWLLQRRAHIFLAPLFRNTDPSSAPLLPPAVRASWLRFLAAQPPLSLRRLGEAVIQGVTAVLPPPPAVDAGGAGHAFSPVARDVAAAAVNGLDLLGATAAIDRELAAADPRAAWAALEAAEARFRRTGDPADRAVATTTEAHLLRLAELETHRTERLQSVLDLLDALEAAERAVSAGAPPALAGAVQRLQATAASWAAAEREVAALEAQR